MIVSLPAESAMKFTGPVHVLTPEPPTTGGTGPPPADALAGASSPAAHAAITHERRIAAPLSYLLYVREASEVPALCGGDQIS
jgi:hypothetical protein